MAQLRATAAIAPNDTSQLHTYWALSDTLRSSGKNRESLSVLDSALALSTRQSDRVETELRRGSVLHGLGRFDDATAVFEVLHGSVDRLPAAQQAALFIERGNLFVDRGELSDAIDAFDRAHDTARAAGLADAAALARLNALRARFDAKDLSTVEADFGAIEDSLAAAAPQHAEMLLALAELYRRAVNEFAYPRAWRGHSVKALNRATQITSDAALLGYANGFLGALYEDEDRLDEARRLTARALFHAQQAGDDAQIYRWEWQLGRILRREHRLPEAEAAYARAAELLTRVKSNFVRGSRNTFNRLVAPVYMQYADVLLSRAATLQAGPSRRELLIEVRDLLETLKQAEVEDYFASECMVRNTTVTQSALLPRGSAVVYPIFLDRRIEVLIESGGDIAQFTTPIGANQATQVIRRFRVNLERETAGDAYLQQARTLYSWLLAPAEAFLDQHAVKTLVIVPEGALRTVPFAALNDGRRFLIERYAVATTPAIKLTQAVAAAGRESLLIGGLTESVQGYSSLPNVGVELETIATLYAARTMQDVAFQMKLVTAQLESPEFSVAHFATHGEFNQDYRKSFILTYDDKLTLSALQRTLEQRGDTPLDLLVLSACQTAAGDDRAALGLAGVAVQSGAKSALASLWSISDAATAELVARFYSVLKSASGNKAESLQAAQLELLRSDRYQHPSYWAPYLLIGNWL